jgi:hypothetical protein
MLHIHCRSAHFSDSVVCSEGVLCQKEGSAQKSSKVLEIVSVVHFQSKAFNPGHLFVYQLADVGGGPANTGT